MRLPSPLVLVFLLLLAISFVPDHPFLQALCIVSMTVMVLSFIVRLLDRGTRTQRVMTTLRSTSVVWFAGGLLAALAATGMLFVRPHTLRLTYTPDNVATAPGIVDERGFYRIETDAAGNRFAWTQERATLILNFLVQRPITVTLDLRSAAAAGGPDRPVRVQVNGVSVGEVRPAPANADFQPLTLRFSPYNWGGGQTELKLLATPFQPGKGDSRTLGVMVRSITVDRTEAWAGIQRFRWIEAIIPIIALALSVRPVVARRWPDRAGPGYAAIAACGIGTVCAAFALTQIARVGVIDPVVYRAWILGYGYLALSFAIAGLTLPFGAMDAANLCQRACQALESHPLPRRTRQAMNRLGILPQGTGAPRAEIAGGGTMRRDLALVFAIALGVRLVWALVIPPWQAPDEPSHFTYVAYIAEHGEVPRPPYLPYPQLSSEVTTSVQLTFLNQLSPTVAGTDDAIMPYLPVTYDYARAQEYVGSHEDRMSRAAGRATPYPPLYYFFAALPYKLFQQAPILTRLFAVRCGSAVLGALTCVFGYLLAYELRRERRWGWALALCLAFMPMFAFVTSTVNNDAGMDLGATVLIWLLLFCYRRETLSARTALVVGLVSGLTLLVKPGPLPVVLTVSMFVLIKAFPIRTRPFRLSPQRFGALGLYTAGGLLGYGPWMLFRHRYYGDLSPGLGSLTHLLGSLGGITRVAAAPSDGGGFPMGMPDPGLGGLSYSLFDYIRHLTQSQPGYFHWLFLPTVWGHFGWLDAPMPDSAFAFISIVCAIGIAGFAIQIALQPQRRPTLVILFAVVAVHLVFLFVVVDYYENYAKTGHTLGLQGRYFFPVLAPALLLLLSGWDHLCREHPIALRLAPVAMAAVQLVGIATILARYYGVVIG